MKLVTYETAKELVSLYNELRDVRAAAAKAQMLRYDAYRILNWLWSVEFSRDKDLGIQHVKQALPPLTRQRWVNYLYAKNFTAQQAAVALGWSVHDVLHSCGGPKQWLLPSGRKPVLELAEIDEEGGDSPADNDPAPEEIAARAAEIQANWTPSQRRIADVHNRHRRVEISTWSDDRI